MAKNLQPGDTVYVPWARLKFTTAADQRPSAMTSATVLAIVERKVELSVPGEEDPVTVASSAVHDNAGIAIIRIGDFASEATLLDPLAKSVLQYCRLLVTDDVRLWELRTEIELRQIWTQYHGAYRHVVLIAHGGPNGLTFGTDPVSAESLGQVFSLEDQAQKLFISLCCETGQANFARPFSMAAGCEALIAPFQSIHGAVGSQFCQTLLAFHLLEGRTTKVAFKNAQQLVPNGARFRFWQKGELV